MQTPSRDCEGAGTTDLGSMLAFIKKDARIEEPDPREVKEALDKEVRQRLALSVEGWEPKRLAEQAAFLEALTHGWSAENPDIIALVDLLSRLDDEAARRRRPTPTVAQGGVQPPAAPEDKHPEKPNVE